MKSEGYIQSNSSSTVRIVSANYSNFFLIILEFFNNIQLYLIIYINKLMEIIFQQPEKKKCNKSEFQAKINFADKRRLNVV